MSNQLDVDQYAGPSLLYSSVKPADGLEWYELTPQQRADYRESWQIAKRRSDVLARKAAVEVAADAMAQRYDWRLADGSAFQQAAWREAATDIINAYERTLRDGQAATDARILHVSYGAES